MLNVANITKNVEMLKNVGMKINFYDAKYKIRNQLVDDNLNSAIICAVSCCEPRCLEILKSTETRIFN